jgi:lipoprotein-anchoring transpeptidase ErfK/SrfK
MAGFIPNLDGSLNASFDPNLITEYVENTLAPALATKPKTEHALIDSRGQTVAVPIPGVVGRTLAQVETLVASIGTCLTTGEDSSIAMEFIETPYTTETTALANPPSGSENSHWADVNLTLQTVTLMDGTTAGATYLISSGTERSPTPEGTFYVYAKTPIQTLSGCDEYECWWYERVRWLTWFRGDYGFHTAYWHDDFGTPVSHGCLNMREDEAEAVYDWLVRGNAVHIHT